MKFFLDLFPVVIFFILYKTFGIFAGTAGLMAGSVIQIILLKIIYKKIEFMYKISFAFIIIFGAITLFFHDARFLQWKVSILNWALGVIFLASQILTDKSLIERMMSHQIPLPKKIFSRLNLIWGSFFIILGSINLYVMYNYSMADWVNFKLFGMMILTMIFMVFQTVYLFMAVKKHQDHILQNQNQYNSQNNSHNHSKYKTNLDNKNKDLNQGPNQITIDQE